MKKEKKLCVSMRRNKAKPKQGIFMKEMKKNGSVYLMFLPAALLLILFNYMPLGGLVIAFKDFNFSQGIWGSDWMSPLFENFRFLFTSEAAIRSFINTLILNTLFIVTGVIFEVGLALLLNEIHGRIFRKVAQSFTLLPYFVSWIVVGVFTYNLFSADSGMINGLLQHLGMEKVSWYSKSEWWPAILTVINRWKGTGYGAIIYFAALSGIDATYYEAAEIDRATKWQQIRYITIPLLMPTVIVMTLLNIGKIMNADFGMFFAIVGDAPGLFKTTDVIDTFVYRSLRQTGDIGMASAAGFVQSIISFILVLFSNRLARKIDSDSAIF